MKRLFLTIIATISILSASATLEDVRSDIRAEYLSSTPSPQTGEWVGSLGRDGRWPDIDYTDGSRSLWQLEKHLDRLVGMSLAYEQASRKDKKHIRPLYALSVTGSIPATATATGGMQK